MDCGGFHFRWGQALAPGGSDQFAVDFGSRLARMLDRATTYGLGVRLRSSRVAGFEWEVTQAGQTGFGPEPRLPIIDGQWVADGSCILTCRPISTASLEAQISGVVWDTPAGITVSGETWDTAQRASATLSVASDVEPGEYEILVTATAGTKVIPQVCVLEVGSC